ncbi:MAG: VacJ family lipoprotein [Alphaproteobacteria bacterium]|jgi:phospholipid-binding lipoprotein MlaA|nr:VacJ family lipoprotein [Alphaproteobacteria bacterium]MDP6817703.1 VacJ family lipoprotein [Alphaproteobacteria bacterium]
MRAAIAAALFAFIAFALPLAAQAAAPADVAAEFERLAAAYPADSATPPASQSAGGENQLAAAVIGAIAARPALAGEITEAAIRAMPHLAGGLVDKTLGAFPGFREIILAAAGRAQMAAPIERDSVVAAVVETASADAPLATPAPPRREEITAPPPAPVARHAGGLGAEEISDPLEGFNRAVFFLNDGLDTILIRPIAYLYGNILPPFVKRRVRNFFTNVNEPVTFANDLLQLEFEDAGVIGARFLVNSTVGLAGLFDVASEIGLEPHKADFGQTLYSYGTGPGPYLVLPLLGPSNLRDSTGLVVDAVLNPFTWLLEPEENIAIAVGKGLVRREELLVPLDSLRESSVDYYAALRSLYYQDRAVALGRGSAADNSALDAEFEAFE